MDKDSSWIIIPKHNLQTQIRLFCFPYAGRGASAYHLWPAGLHSSIGVCRIQLPGRENRLREHLFTQLQPLVETLAKALRPHLKMPFALFGHSVGALMCFEVARQLRRQDGLSPVRLFVSACRAPQIRPREPAVYQLPDAEFVEELRRRYNGSLDAALQQPELMQLLTPILRADMRMLDTYVYEDDTPLDCPIFAFGGVEDSQVHQEDLLGWRYQTRSTFTVRMFPSNHFFLHHNRPALLQALSNDLKMAVEETIRSGHDDHLC